MAPLQQWDNHERRIETLEKTNEATQQSLNELKESLIVSQAVAGEQSRIIMNQNESLLSGYQKQSEQMATLIDGISRTREKEAERTQELKRLSNDTRLKLFTMIIGGGGVGTMLVGAALKLFGLI